MKKEKQVVIYDLTTMKKYSKIRWLKINKWIDKKERKIIPIILRK